MSKIFDKLRQSVESENKDLIDVIGTFVYKEHLLRVISDMETILKHSDGVKSLTPIDKMVYNLLCSNASLKGFAIK